MLLILYLAGYKLLEDTEVTQPRTCSQNLINSCKEEHMPAVTKWASVYLNNEGTRSKNVFRRSIKRKPANLNNRLSMEGK